MVTEYVYLNVDSDELALSHSTRNEMDKYADNQPCIKIEGEEEYVDFILDSLFEK